tara:strand:- start:306 stop:1121 length:816 start_codon:yes stop_codon:yes gene_type:complete
MTVFNIYKNDILNRFPGHTLTRTTNSSKIIWTLKDSGNNFVQKYEGNNDSEVLRKLRINLGFPTSIMLISTTAQKNALSQVETGQEIFDTDLNQAQEYNGSAWITSGLEERQGFIDYNDSSTATTPLLLSSNVWTDIPNDGLGAFTNKTYRPQGINELMDTSTGKIDVTDLILGDAIIIRNDFTVTPQTNNASLKFRYTLGNGGNSYTLEKRLGRLDEGSGVGYRFSLTTDEIYMGDTNTRDNPIGLQLNLSTTGTLVNAGTVITVIRYKV